MTDIVDRLRECSGDVGFAECIVLDAANEIERLRAAIDQLRSVAGTVSIESGLTFSDIKKQTKIANNG